MEQPESTKIHKEVQRVYGDIASRFSLEAAPTLNPKGAGCCVPTHQDKGCGCGCAADADTQSGNDYEALFGNLYSADTEWLPEGAVGLSLGCGDPVAHAMLKPGQTVLDLGSGAGIDCFMAARQVGSTGHVIGVDMTPAMLEKANLNRTKLAAHNVEFREGQIEHLPVASDTVDVIISNCVVNLSPNKATVFKEAFRVLKPGGRIAISDIVTRGHFTAEEKADMQSWTGCITGAEHIADYTKSIKSAGFTDILIQDKNNPNIELTENANPGKESEVISARVLAVKPALTT